MFGDFTPCEHTILAITRCYHAWNIRRPLYYLSIVYSKKWLYYLFNIYRFCFLDWLLPRDVGTLGFGVLKPGQKCFHWAERLGQPLFRNQCLIMLRWQIWGWGRPFFATLSISTSDFQKWTTAGGKKCLPQIY